MTGTVSMAGSPGVAATAAAGPQSEAAASDADTAGGDPFAAALAAFVAPDADAEVAADPDAGPVAAAEDTTDPADAALLAAAMTVRHLATLTLPAAAATVATTPGTTPGTAVVAGAGSVVVAGAGPLPDAVLQPSVPTSAPADQASTPLAGSTGQPTGPATVPTGTPTTMPGMPAAAAGLGLTVPVSGAVIPVVVAEQAPAGRSTPTSPVPETATDLPDVTGATGVAAGSGAGGRGIEVPAAPPAPREVPVATQVVRQVAVLRGAPDGAYTMTVQITPDEIGPVSIQVTVDDGQVEMTLRGAHEHGRAALAQALPELRRDLEGAGLSCNKVEVDLDSDQSSWFSSQPDAGGGREERHEPADRRTRSWMSSGDHSDNPPVAAADQSSPTGVDVRM